jgi:membrane associated rhomboid family serine protease
MQDWGEMTSANICASSPKMDAQDQTSVSASKNLFERTWAVPWHCYVLPTILAVIIFVCWLSTPKDVAESMALSWAGLRQGRTATIWMHMFAHGNLLHVLLNCAALLALSGPLIARLGPAPLSWGRYLYLFFGSGLSGAALFLVLNHSAAMLGASGAIFGVFGALARVHPNSGVLVPVKSHRTWLLVWAFVREHLLMFAIVVVVALVWGKSASIAWQAHVGGLLFGVFAASFFLERPAGPRAIEEDDS